MNVKLLHNVPLECGFKPGFRSSWTIFMTYLLSASPAHEEENNHTNPPPKKSQSSNEPGDVPSTCIAFLLRTLIKSYEQHVG